jgi:hypothetical protein
VVEGNVWVVAIGLLESPQYSAGQNVYLAGRQDMNALQ